MNPLTLILTVEAIIMMFLMRRKLARIPLIGLVVVAGYLINIGGMFKSFSDICQSTDHSVKCEF